MDRGQAEQNASPMGDKNEKPGETSGSATGKKEYSSTLPVAQLETINDKHKNPQASEGVRPRKGGEKKKAGKL